MKNKNIIIVVLTLGLIVTLFFSRSTTRLCESLNKKNKAIISELNDYKYTSKRLREKQFQNLFSENQIIPNITLLNAKLDSVSLTSVVGSGTKLVYRFYEETCVQCVEDELDILKKNNRCNRLR